MQSAKRIYLYGILGIALVPLLWGLSDLLRFAFDQLGSALGVSPAFMGSFAREELSRALALVLVAGGIVVVHLALLRSLVGHSRADAADERAATSRAVYFFLVVAGTGAVLLWSTFDLVYGLIGSWLLDRRDLDPAGRLAGVIVVGGAWALHLLARRGDIRSAPARLAGDWLTRAYLYGALFTTWLIVVLQSGEALTTVARRVLGLRPPLSPGDWWQEALTGALAALIVAALGWLTQWLIVNRLLGAPDPVGASQRNAASRRGYFLAVSLVSAFAVLMLSATSLGAAAAALLGTWTPTEGSRLIEDVGGPLLLLLPFALGWWWHQRRVVREAEDRGGAPAARALRRTAHLVVAFVGLVGLAAGLAWELQVVIDSVTGAAPDNLIAMSGSEGDSTRALGLALVGLLLWVPAWVMTQRDRARHTGEAAGAVSRRAYLTLVSGLSVVAAMGSSAFLVWQATRTLLDSGPSDDSSWAIAILTVATVVLLYHLWQLRRDARAADTIALRAAESGETSQRTVETIEIIAPPDADFRVLNAAIRSELPDGYEMRVLPRSP